MFVFFFFFKQKTAYEISACLVGSEMCIRDRSGATDVLSYSIYRDAFVNYQFSPAAAKSVLLFLILLGVTVFQMKNEKKRVFYQ